MTVDNIAPTVQSVTRVGPAATNAANVQYTVTFSEPVTGVGAGTFTPVLTGTLAGATVSGVTGGPAVYAVTVAVGAGDGTVRLDVPASAAVLDAAGNALAAAFAAGDVITLDRTAPTIALSAPTPAATAAGSVAFTVTYAGADTITLAPANVSLLRTGTANAGTITVTGTGNTRTVTLSGVTGDGTLAISLAANTASDLAGNQAAAAGPSATVLVDNTAPAVSIGAPSAPITNGGPVSFVVTYTDANALGITLAPGNVTVNATGTAAASGVSVTGTGNTRTVTLSGITGDGTLGITLAAGTATDPAGNAAPADGPGATFAVDNTAPTLVIGAPSAPATATAPVSFDITYSGASAITLAPGDITLVRTGTANAGTVAVTGTGNVRTVTLSGITGDGTIAIAVAANTAADAAGNPAPAAGPSAAFAVDAVAPTVLGVTRLGPAVTSGGSVQYTVTFSEPVSGVGAATFTPVVVSGALASAVVGPVTGGPSVYTVTVAVGAGDGTLGLTVPATPAVTDAAGNGLTPTSPAGQLFTLDRTAPTVTIGAPSVALTRGGPVSFDVTYADANAVTITLAPGDVTLTGTAAAAGVTVTGSGNVRTVTLTGVTGDGPLGISIGANTASDAATNAAPAAGPSAAATVDNTAPTVTSVTRAAANPTAAGTVAFTVVFGEDVATPAAGAFTLTPTGTLSGLSVTGVTPLTPRTFRVDVVVGGGAGTLRLDVPAGATADAAGNPVAAFAAGETFAIDRVAPTATVGTPANGGTITPGSYGGALAGTAADVGSGVAFVEYRVLDSLGRVWNGTTFGRGTWATASGTTAWTVPFAFANFPADGAYRVEARATDGLGTVGAVAAADITVALPTVTGIARLAPAADPSNAAGPVTWRVTFSDAVTGLTAANFALAGSFAGTSAITVVTASGAATWDVTANVPATGTGTIELDFVSNAGLTPHVSTATLAGAVVTLDRVAPTVTITNDAPAAVVRVGVTVHYTITFADDLGLAGATLAAAANAGTAPATVGTPVAAGPNSFTIDVTPTGEGTVQLRLAAGSVADAAGNAIAFPVTDSVTLTADGTAPTVLSVTPITSSPTNAGVVEYTVTFSEDVTGVDDTDFAVAVTGAVVPGNVTVTRLSGTTYAVAIDTGSGDGTVRLDVLADGSILDAPGNPLAVGFTTAAAVEIDKTAPTATVDLAATQPNPAGTQPLRFVVTFSEPVIGFTDAGVELSGTAGGLGTAAVVVDNPSGDNQTFTVEVSGLTGDGFVSVNVRDAAARDAAGNVYAAVTASGGVSLDTSPPTVASITRDFAAPTNAGTVTYTVTFDEDVTGVDDTDFVLTSTVGATISGVSGGGTIWTVTIDTGSGTGTVRLDLAAAPTIADLAGNPLAGPFTGETYHIDRTAPTATITAATPDPRHTPVDSLDLTFSEDVIGLDVTAFTLTRDGAPLDLSAATLTGTGTSYTLGGLAALTAAGGDYVLTLSASLAALIDLAGNPLAADATTAFTVDTTAPTVTITPVTTGPTNAGTVTFTVTFTEPVFGVDTDPTGGFDFFAAAGTAPGTGVVSVTPAGPGAYTVVVDAGTGDGTVGLRLAAGAAIFDAAGNAVASLPATGAAVPVDHTRPMVTITDSDDADGVVPVTGPVTFTVDVLDAGGVSGTLAAGDFSNAGTAAVSVGAVAAAPIAGGRRFTVPVTPLGAGTILLRLDSGAVLDAAGNAPTFPTLAGRPLAVDAVAPTATIARAAGQALVTKSQPIVFTVTFSEPVVGFGATRVSVSAGTASVTGSGPAYTVSVTGVPADGAVTLTVPAGAAADLAGNPSAAAPAGDNTVTLDTAPPAVSAPVVTPPGTVTSDTTPTFTGTAEAGATVELLAGGTVVGTTVALGGVWSITSTVLGDGAVNFTARATDAAGNAATSAATAVTIDTGAPTVAVTRSPGQTATVVTGGPVTSAVTFAVTFSEPVSGLDPAALAVDGATGGAVTSITGSGASYLVTVAGIDRPGTVTLTVAAGGGTDAAGNPSAGAPAGEAVAVTFTTSAGVFVGELVGGSVFVYATQPRANHPIALAVSVGHFGPADAAGSVRLTLVGPGGTVVRTLPIYTPPGLIFSDATGLPSSPPPAGTGSAAFEFPALAAGAYTATAEFLGTNGFLDSTATRAFTVFPDLPVGQNSTDVFAAVAGTTVTLYNPDGSARGTAVPFSRDESPYGVRVAVADVTGDGVPDVIAGTAPTVPAAVRVIDGATGATLYSVPVLGGFAGGVFVAAGDLDGDGVAEIVVSPDQGGGPRVLVLDGRTGAERASFFGIDDANFRGGARVAVGDLNRDGRADIVVAAGYGGGPRVAGFDGASVGAGLTPRRLFADFFVFAPDLRDGTYVAVGDVDGDGYGDLLAGAGPGGGPRVLGLSGHDLVTTNTLTPVANFFAGPSDLRGGVRVVAKDFDGDGRADLVTGSGDTGRVFVFTNADLFTGTPADELNLMPGLLAGVHVG